MLESKRDIIKEFSEELNNLSFGEIKVETYPNLDKRRLEWRVKDTVTDKAICGFFSYEIIEDINSLLLLKQYVARQINLL